MMAISQILYVQYHIWDIFGLGVKSKKKMLKKQLNEGNHGQGTDIAKISADNLAENTQKYPKIPENTRKCPNVYCITPKFVLPICPIGPKF